MCASKNISNGNSDQALKLLAFRVKNKPFCGHYLRMTNMRLHLCGQATIYCLLAGPSGGFLFKPTPTFTHSISENIFRGISSSPKRRNSRTNSSSKFDVPRAVASARMSTSRHLGKLLPPSTVFFACDIQERFRDIILNMPSVISTAR